MKRKPRRVSNPVTRALAKDAIRKHLLMATLKVYSFKAGEDVSEFMSGTIHSVAIVGMAVERQWPTDMPTEVDVDLRVLRGGMSAMEQTLRCWDLSQAVAIEQCLLRVERLNNQLKGEHLVSAYLDVMRIDAQYAKPIAT